MQYLPKKGNSIERLAVIPVHLFNSFLNLLTAACVVYVYVTVEVSYCFNCSLFHVIFTCTHVCSTIGLYTSPEKDFFSINKQHKKK